jgi:hypothetical protein
MISGLFAFAFAAAFAGAALYVNLVEQPARLGLDDAALVREWAPSDRRGFALLGGLALASALTGLAAYGHTSDIRWLVGAILILASWPYTYFIIVPLNNRLLAQPQPGADSREMVRDWGRLEWGLAALGVAASVLFGGILA